MPKANILNREKGERSLGSLFAAARQRRGLPIEKAAHDTRIRVQRLREIEEDDFSHFSHPSYARLFLSDYGRYLGIPVEEFRHLLPERGECGAEGYQYLQEVTVSAPTYSYTIPRQAKQNRYFPAIATAVLIPVLAVVAFFGYKTVRDIGRLNGHAPTAKVEAPASGTTEAPAAAPVAASAPTEVGVDNAVPAPEAPATADAATPASSPAAETASAEGPSPAAPAVSPEQRDDDHAALSMAVGGTPNNSGRVQ